MVTQVLFALCLMTVSSASPYRQRHSYLSRRYLDDYGDSLSDAYLRYSPGRYYGSNGYSLGGYYGNNFGRDYSRFGYPSGPPFRNYYHTPRFGFYPSVRDLSGYDLDEGISNGITFDGYGRGLARQTGFGTTVIDGAVSGIIRDFRQEPLHGSYSFAYETDDGISREESGSPILPNGPVAKEGSYSFTYPDGTPAHFNYIADENGFRVQSNLIPPIPEHSLAQIEQAERERAAGIIHDGQYRSDDYLRDSLFGRGSGIGGRYGPFNGLSGISDSFLNPFEDIPYGLGKASYDRNRAFLNTNKRGAYEDSDSYLDGKTLSGFSTLGDSSYEPKGVNDKREVKQEKDNS